MKERERMSNRMKEIYLAGGCFWGLEKYLAQINGVKETQVGYANGKTEQPTYQDVCYLNTGHAETVKIMYNPETISLQKLLQFFFKVIDPTSLNKQWNDVGTQYRTGIYYTEREDQSIIEEAIQGLQKKYEKPIALK